MNAKNITRAVIFSLTVMNVCFDANAQVWYLYSAQDSLPLSHLTMQVKSLGNGESHLLLSNQAGIINPSADNLTFPVIVKVSNIYFQTYLDTIQNSSDQNIYLYRKQNKLNEVVITGQYAPGTQANSVHVVKVINRVQIDKMGAQNLRDVLRQSMNIRIHQDNILGSSMSLQGVSGQDVKILIDGVPVIGRLNGNVDLSQINMNNVSRIEIVEGPLSVNYGTDALAGTINIITQKNQKQKYIASANAYYESIGKYNVSGKGGFRFGKNSLQLNLGRNYFDGWHQGEKSFHYVNKIKSDDSRFQTWKPKEQFFAGLQFSHQFKNLTLTAASNAFDENIFNRGKPRPPYGESAMDDRYHTFRNNNRMDLKGALNDNYRIHFLFSYNYYHRIKNTFLRDLTTLGRTLTKGNGDQDSTAFNAFVLRGDITTTKLGKFNYQLGYDLSYESDNTDQIIGQHQRIGDYALFGTVEYTPVANFIIKPGLRYSYNTKFNAPLIPSINLKYSLPINRLSGSSKIAFRGSYARGFRAPSLKELFFDFVDVNHNIHGNKDLRAEYSDNFIFNIIFSKAFGQNYFKLEWNNFYNQINNLIVLAQIDPNAAEYTYGNIGYFKTYGSSLTGHYVHKNIKASLSGGFVASMNQAQREVHDLPEFLLSPEFKGSLIYDWSEIGLSFAAFYKYTGKLPSYLITDKGEVQQSKLEDYQMADVSVTQKLFNNKLQITIGSKNLFNVTNLTGNLSTGNPHSGNNTTSPLSMGRSYFIQLNLNLRYNS